MQKERLDTYVHSKTPSLSRAFAQKLIKDQKVSVNGQVITKTGYKITPNDKITINYQEETIPDIELPILYEDEDVIVIDKPSGLLTHSKGSFNPEPTVATWLERRVGRFEDNARMGIVHRLDRATSGVMICAKHPASLEWLQKQFSDRKALKTYFALIEGEIEPKAAIIDLPIERNPKRPQTFRVGAQGKKAQTTYEVARTFSYISKRYSLLQLKPKTGRTHQLRVHLEYMKKPIIGDTIYNGIKADRLYLHAHALKLTLPNKKQLLFTSDLPEQFLKPKIVK